MKLFRRSFYTVTICSIFFLLGCTKPTKDIKVVINGSIIKYSAMIKVSDAASSTTIPPGLTIKVSGQDSSAIYEISGSKDLSFSSGIISLGPTPTRVPTANDPVKFTVTISATGYKTVTQNIQINAGETQQAVSIGMAKNATKGSGTVTVSTAPPATQTAQTTAVTLDFTGTCSNKPDFEFKPSNYIFYKVDGSTDAYQYLGYMDNGIITSQLQLGITYDFEFVYAGQTYTVVQDVNDVSYSETVDLGTDLCNNL